ncbi:MAG: methionyl-tRNA formyltransferase [Myxococcota bacterium]
MKKRVVFMGTPAFAAPCVHVLASHPDIDLVAVVCQPDRRHGRHKTPQPPPCKVAALECGVPEILQPKRLKKGAFPERLKALAPDLIVVTAYGRILPKRILELPALGCVNVHASDLPRWRGAAPLQWAVAEGDSQTGVCLMVMEEGLDTGPVLARTTTAITPEDTGQSLHDRLSEQGAALLAERLDDLLAQRLEPDPQDETLVTYARMLTREDGRLDWSQSASLIDCRIRGFFPWPGAFTTLPDGRTLKLFPPAVMADQEGDANAAAGTVLECSERLVVATGSGTIAVTEVQLQGKRRMSVSDFSRGAALPTGTLLGA